MVLQTLVFDSGGEGSVLRPWGIQRVEQDIEILATHRPSEEAASLLKNDVLQ